MQRRRLASLAAVLALAACEPEQIAPPPATPPSPPVKAPGPRVIEQSLKEVGLDPTAMDRSVDPCQDFYQFACGNWIATTQIPADKPYRTRGFSTVAERSQAIVRKILEDAAAGKGEGDPVMSKIGAFYGACMDEDAIETARTKPLSPLFDLVKKVKHDKSLSAAVTELHKRGIWALFEIADTQDAKDATKVIAELDQSGFALPDRDYYLKDDDKMKDVRRRYGAHVEKMMSLAGWPAPEAKQAAADVMRIESELARASKRRVERRDPATMYNRLDRDGVAKAAPRFLWDDYLKGLGHAEMSAITVTAPRFLEAVNLLIEKEKPAAWRSYLAWQVVLSTVSALPKALVDESFAFEAALSGQKEQRARWKRCVLATNEAVAELIAQPFIKEHFTPESREATERYAREMAKAFGEGVEKLEWMDAPTKAKATEKLRAMAYLIGYPKQWKSYDFEVKPRSYLENLLAAATWRVAHSLAKVGKPVPREEWSTPPQMVNASYDAQLNRMVFPAGMLQPPFYDPRAAVAVNLGGLGMVVGHELTHGFDDRGAQFDANGNLTTWWTEQDSARFKARTGCLVEQYEQYEPLPGVKLDGKLTLGENIADGGGVKVAFHAYRAMRQDAAEVVRAEGFTEDQQFFLGVGQVWCEKRTDETTRLLAQIDTHSPPRFRVNGSLANLPEFAAAFSCAEGMPMRRANTCSIW